ncbi:MAG TPA: peptidase S10 [Candidatus Limnocylindria bacterium]|nr:peptidase S10 [Candidatus Limnocylindria bacterium]
MKARIVSAACVLAVAACALASPSGAADAAPIAVTHHQVTVAGKPITYTATAETVTLHDSDGNPTAEVFTVAYTADGADRAKRPVTFVWNGGPGSSSMWLQMGSFGPMRVDVPSDATRPRPDAPLVPNADSLIDTTDLVYIDAVGTGYSRIVGKGAPTSFYGVDQDAKAFEQTITGWLRIHDRWASPKFLFGESYGTTRAANVVNLLEDDGVGVNGVVLLSSVLDFNALDNGQGPGEDYQYINFLPTEAAVAWYHHRVPGNPPDLTAFLAQVRRFAAGPYAEALMRGDLLDAGTRAAIVAQLHAYTGLDAAYIDRADLRLDPSRFEHELLHAQGELTGRLDGRYVGADLDRTADTGSYDPTSDDTLTDAFVTDFSRYVQDDLRYKADRPYLGTNYSVVLAHWNYRRTNSLLAPNVAGDLRAAIVKNPYLHVFSANGYFDLATPFFGTEYTINHLDLPPALRRNITFGYYLSGHMVYLNGEARRALRADLLTFYREAMVR